MHHSLSPLYVAFQTQTNTMPDAEGLNKFRDPEMAFAAALLDMLQNKGGLGFFSK